MTNRHDHSGCPDQDARLSAIEADIHEVRLRMLDLPTVSELWLLRQELARMVSRVGSLATATDRAERAA